MANQLDNLKVGDLVKNKNDGITWRVTAINGEFSRRRKRTTVDLGAYGMNYGKFRRTSDEGNAKPVVYRLTNNVAFSEVIPDKRLNFSHLGLLAILLTYFTTEMKFTAENFRKYTYEGECVAAANLLDLEKLGYVSRAE